MSAVPGNTVVPFSLPKKPRVREAEPIPDQRKVVVLPFKAVFDERMTHGALQALAALCAYCNRAGITWVSQTRLAKELGISQQAVAKQFKQLRDLGYLETVKKGFKGERTDTLRVIFDPSVDTATAISITSSVEDTRPPHMKQEQAKQAQEAQESDPAGQRRIAQLLASALRNHKPKKDHTMPKTSDTPAVKEVKEAMKKAQARRTKAVEKPVDNPSPNHNPQVVNEGAVQLQPNHNPGVVENTENIYIRDKVDIGIEEIDKVNLACVRECVDACVREGMTQTQVRDACEILLPLFTAEGITPSGHVLAQAVMQMHRDAA